MERAQSCVRNCSTGAVELRAGAASVTGRVHEELGDGNEDGYLIDRQHFVFALYDTHVCSLAMMLLYCASPGATGSASPCSAETNRGHDPVCLCRVSQPTSSGERGGPERRSVFIAIT